MSSLRTFWQVNLFAMRTLQSRGWLGLAISLLLFVLAAWLGVEDYHAGAWLSFTAGVAGVARETWTLAKASRAPSRMKLKRDYEFISRLVERVAPAEEEIRDGFHVVPLPAGNKQAVVRSEALDSWLRKQSQIPMVEDVGKRKDVDLLLRDHANYLESILRCHARKSLRSTPPRVLLNERKLGLTDGPSPDRPSLRVHPTSYFHSLLTNEAATHYLESLGEDPRVLFSGGEHLFPWHTRAESWRLLALSYSQMADHIGISTLVVTRDRKLVFWSQAENSQQSRNQFVSTGSGSCDWEDRVDGDLKATLIGAMEREFREESFGGKKLPGLKCETRILGYFRWVSRGGKPEFTGVTRADVDSHELSPNTAEVNRRGGRTELYRDVPTLADLVRVLDDLHASPQASVSFWANALALREAIGEAPEDWGAFLRLPLGALRKDDAVGE